MTKAVVCSITIHSFSWKFKFLVFDQCPVLCILGSIFISFTKVRLYFGSHCYSFGSEPAWEFHLQSLDFCKQRYSVLRCSEDTVSRLACQCVTVILRYEEINQLVASFCKLFSENLGTVKGMVCNTDLMDVVVRSHPYQCSPLGCRFCKLSKIR
jgi:hypothetical protein